MEGKPMTAAFYLPLVLWLIAAAIFGSFLASGV